MLCPSQERSRCYQGYCLPYPFLLSIHPFLSDRPCKIVDMSTSKTGKHGHAKVHLVGIDVRSLFSLSPNKTKKNLLSLSHLDLHWKKICQSISPLSFIWNQFINLPHLTGRSLSFHSQHGCSQCHSY